MGDVILFLLKLVSKNVLFRNQSRNQGIGIGTGTKYFDWYPALCSPGSFALDVCILATPRLRVDDWQQGLRR